MTRATHWGPVHTEHPSAYTSDLEPFDRIEVDHPTTGEAVPAQVLSVREVDTGEADETGEPIGPWRLQVSIPGGMAYLDADASEVWAVLE